MNDFEKLDKEDKLFPVKLKERLPQKFPECLYALGNSDLLSRHGISFAGSRKVLSQGLSIVKDCVEEILHKDKDIVIISGYSRGVDMEAHYQALKNGGSTLIVLAEGIKNFRIRKTLEEVWDWERVLVVSPYEPDDVWKVYRAMQRGKLIVGLSSAVIIIEAGERSGTLDTGEQSLRMNVPLYVVEYNQETIPLGNKALLEKGANKLLKRRSTGRISVDKVMKQVSSDNQEMLLFPMNTVSQ